MVGWLVNKVKVKFTHEQAIKTRRGCRGKAILFNFGERWGGWSARRPSPLIPENEPVPTAQGAGWAPGPVWTLAENLAPHRHSITELSSPVRVAIPTELSRLTLVTAYVLTLLTYLLAWRHRSLSVYRIRQKQLTHFVLQ